MRERLEADEMALGLTITANNLEAAAPGAARDVARLERVVAADR